MNNDINANSKNFLKYEEIIDWLLKKLSQSVLLSRPISEIENIIRSFIQPEGFPGNEVYFVYQNSRIFEADSLSVILLHHKWIWDIWISRDVIIVDKRDINKINRIYQYVEKDKENNGSCIASVELTPKSRHDSVQIDVDIFSEDGKEFLQHLNRILATRHKI